MNITLTELCTDIRQIGIRRTIAQDTRKELENVLRGRIGSVFLDNVRQPLLRKCKMSRRDVELKVLEKSKDKTFKKLMLDVREALTKSVSLSQRKAIANNETKLKALRRKCPDQMMAIETSVIGLLLGLKALYAEEQVSTSHLEEVADRLPVWQQWASKIPGLGLINLGKMVGDTGPLSNFHSKEGLYKYLGLGVFNGHAQGKIRGRSIKGDAAITEGFQRRRLSNVLLIGQGILKIGGVKGHENDPYVRLLRVKWADYETKAKVENARIKRENPGLKKAELKALQISPKTVMLRSIRWITKMIVRDLRYAWIACEGKGAMPDPAQSPMLMVRKDKIA